jgi:cytochrome P450
MSEADARFYRSEFDHLAPDHIDRWVEQTDAIRAHGPVGWTDAHGGFWVVVGYDAVRSAALDWRTFSCFHDTSGGCPIAKGIGIPPFDFPLILSESDPPVSLERRGLEQPFFRPPEIQRWEPVVRAHVDAALADIRARGHGDFFADLAMPVTAKTAFALVGVDLERWEEFVARGGAKPTPSALAAEIDRVHGLLEELVADRRRAPRDDIVSALVQGEVQGRGLTDDEAVSMLSALVLGGFDTTSSVIANALIWLDRRRDAHAALRADAVLLANAVDEFLRVYPPSVGGGRNVMRDVELGGCRMARGDRIFLSWAAANRDPDQFEAPHEVRLDRANAAQHFAFGVGPHRCLGSQLARMVTRCVIAAVLEQTPDFRIDHAAAKRYASGRFVVGWSAVPVAV